MFMDFKGTFSLISERDEDKYGFQELNYAF